MTPKFADLVTRHWKFVVLTWLGLIVGITALAPRWDDVTHDGDFIYLPSYLSIVQAENLRRQAFPDQEAQSQMVVVIARPDRKLDDDDLDFAADVRDRLEELSAEIGAIEVWDPDTEILGKKLLSQDAQAALVVAQLRNEFSAVNNIEIFELVQHEVQQLAESSPAPEGLQIGFTGSAAIGGDILTAARESIRNTEITTVILVLLILAVVYRAPLLILIPLLTIGASLAVAMGLVALLTQLHLIPKLEWWNFHIFATTKIFVVVILFGAGTDFCLFLIARYREELSRNREKSSRENVNIALLGISGALIGSALTTVVGLGTMYFADFGKFRNSGPAIALCLMVALAASLTLAPALLSACGRWVFWPLKAQSFAHRQAAASNTLTHRIWVRISHLVTRHPGLILVTSFALMLVPAIQGWNVTVTYDLLNELDKNRISRQGTNLLLNHFAAGETGPVTILAHKPNVDFTTPEGKNSIADLSDALAKTSGISEVRSISQPFGVPPAPSVLSFTQIAERESTRAHQVYLAQAEPWKNKVTRLDLIMSVDPFSLEALDQLAKIEDQLHQIAADPASPWHQAEFHLLGTTAATRDLKIVTESDRWLIQRLVVISVLAVLILLIRKPILCVYLILTVVFGYYVTLGITEWYFAWLHGPTYEGLDWKVPIFLFVILVAVGQDYNIYLVTRVLEEQKKSGRLVEGLQTAVAKTGGIITSCGIIMAGTFISMVSGTMRGMHELGFSLALGIMLDTLIVRPILVPAFLALLYRFQNNTEHPSANLAD